MKRLNFFYIFTLLFIIILIVMAILQEKTLFLSIIDSLFIIGIAYVAIGSFLYIFEKGFFNGIVYALKRFRNSTKQGKYISQFDDLDETKEAYEEYGAERFISVKRSFLVLGSITLLLSVAISYLLYP
ncbi:DUF3899 domain-containing protein [Rossellomorea sp. AcN35-11]|nr:DUF3899 domain-containing protein [Rossellomorea aquimaris]WJV29197.1 DUF3899 domain-containing protein [Rossellomorea sp. AcN35-11]